MKDRIDLDALDAISMNGHAGPAKFLKRLAYHERRAAAYRLVLDDLQHADRVTKKQRTSSVIEHALRLEASSRPAKKKKPNYKSPKEVRRSRARTKRILAGLSTTEPQRIPGTGVAANLLRNGFIAKKGSGYIRTSKPFEV